MSRLQIKIVTVEVVARELIVGNGQLALSDLEGRGRGVFILTLAWPRAMACSLVCALTLERVSPGANERRPFA